MRGSCELVSRGGQSFDALMLSSRSSSTPAPAWRRPSDLRPSFQPPPVPALPCRPQAWILEQKEFANLPAKEPNCYIQVQLDGTVRSSGAGLPPWRQFVEDLPLLSDLRTRLTDGVGPQE